MRPVLRSFSAVLGENLLLVVILALKSKVLYYLKFKFECEGLLLHQFCSLPFQTVNNRPQEKVVISDNALHTSGSRNLCDDTWETGESTCGFDHDAQGNKIWDSQVDTQ